MHQPADRTGWISSRELVPGDTICGLADAASEPPILAKVDDMRVLCSVVTEGSGGLRTQCCYTLRLFTSGGTLEPCWYAPWYSRSMNYNIVAADA